jgi:hypothetical protein
VIGSGQMCADPFVKFLRNTFWPDRLPTVAEGVLAAYWAVDYAIEAGAPYVGPPIEAYALRKGRTKYLAEKVSDEELKTHSVFIRAARDALKGLSNVRNLTADDASQVPTLEVERPAP